MQLVVTGSAGGIGRALIGELSPVHRLRLIDRKRIAAGAWIVADLRRPAAGWRKWVQPASARWRDAFTGADAAVHLAADPRPNAPWESVLANNIEATMSVLEAAAAHRVPRVVFASSNWAVKAVEQELAPGCYLPDGPTMSSETPPRPLTSYGLSKAFGELAGRMFVDEGRLRSFIAVRIGHFHRQAPVHDQTLRARWIGVKDIKTLFRRCVEADLNGFHVVYGVSAQAASPYDLTHTRQLLSWSPSQRPDEGEGLNETA